MSVIPSNLQAVRGRIAEAVRSVHKDLDVRLIAVSKTFPSEAILEAISAGQRDFGENYLQEALPKMAQVDEALRAGGVNPVTWHMIGPLQSNKTKAVAERFAWVHSVERIKIAERLAAQRPLELDPLNVCIQVNISEEASKSGVSVRELSTLAQAVSQMPRLHLRGLMAIPAPGDTSAFQRLAHLRDQLRLHIPQVVELSMGMSDDLEAAVAAGATMVRIGTAIFGERLPQGLAASPSHS